MTSSYSSRPWHLIVSVFLLFLGAVTVSFEGWFWFSVAVFLLGVGSGVWIIFRGMQESYIEYWHEIANVAEVLNKTNKPEIWAAFGFVPPAGAFKAEIDVKQGVYHKTDYFDLPGSMEQFRTFADGTLMGKGFALTEWSGTGKLYTTPVYRKLKDEIVKRSLIREKISGAPTQGYEFTRAGREFFMKYASEGILSLLRSEKNLIAPAKENLQLNGGT